MAELEYSYLGTPYVPYTKFEEYSERFSPFFSMRREDGIIEVKMHELNDPEASANWQYGIHKGWGQLFKLIGQDPENEVLIIGGTGEKFLGIAPQGGKAFDKAKERDMYDSLYQMYPMYRDGSDLVYNAIFDIHIPTIGVINGPSPGHTEFPLLMDMTIMSEDSFIQDPHFTAGYVPGDGQHLINHYLAGFKQANYMAYMGTAISAKRAVELGMANEVVPKDKIYDRAWEMARTIMTKPRIIRRLTHDLMREPLRRFVNDNFQSQFALEWWAAAYDIDPNFRKQGHIGFQHMEDVQNRTDLID